MPSNYRENVFLDGGSLGKVYRLLFPSLTPRAEAAHLGNGFVNRNEGIFP